MTVRQTSTCFRSVESLAHLDRGSAQAAPHRAVGSLPELQLQLNAIRFRYDSSVVPMLDL